MESELAQQENGGNISANTNNNINSNNNISNTSTLIKETPDNFKTTTTSTNNTSHESINNGGTAANNNNINNNNNNKSDKVRRSGGGRGVNHHHQQRRSVLVENEEDSSLQNNNHVKQNNTNNNNNNNNNTRSDSTNINPIQTLSLSLTSNIIQKEEKQENKKYEKHENERNENNNKYEKEKYEKGRPAMKSPSKNSTDVEIKRSDGRRWRRRQWWWRQQKEKQNNNINNNNNNINNRRRRQRSESQTDSQTQHQRQGGRAEEEEEGTEQLHKSLETTRNKFINTNTIHRSLLYMNPNVRCVGNDGIVYSRTLKDLLLTRDAAPAELDTPCLSPLASPICIRVISDDDNNNNNNNSLKEKEEKELRENEEGGDNSNLNNNNNNTMTLTPPISFTLDGVLTPKTFAEIRRQELEMEELPLPASSIKLNNNNNNNNIHNNRRPKLSPHMLRPQELPHQYLLRNYNNGSFTMYNSIEEKTYFFTLCRHIIAQVLPIFASEPLFPQVIAPTFVFGDIHGNFEDLSFFLRHVLIFHDLQLTPANMLCLGDYVDRGPHSLECLILLLSLKLYYPNKVILLRGNHEDRVVCGDMLTYGSSCFLAQCENLYGVDEGRVLFKEVTSLFQHFPLAAELIIPNVPNNNNNNNNNISSRRLTHEEKVLCTHGGIPRFSVPPSEDDSLLFLRNNNIFPRMLTLFPNNPAVRDDPEAQMEIIADSTLTTTEISEDNIKNINLNINSNTSDITIINKKRPVTEAILRKAWYIAFDLMWSDPTSTDPGDDNENNNNNNNNYNNNNNNKDVLNEWGFGVNKRGSNVLTFSAKAVETFLKAHKYSMLFRAHQEKAHGLRLSKSSKVLTIFSSSNYLGHGNGAGCVVVTSDGEVQLVEKMSE